MSISKLKKQVRHVESEIETKKAKISDDYEVLKENANVPLIIVGGLLSGFVLGRLIFSKRKKDKDSSSKTITSGLNKTAILSGLASYILKK